MPQEVIGACLSFLRRKYYEGHDDTFFQDRDRLLKWVVLYPAKWLDNRAVTLPLDRYQQIFNSVFMDAVVFGKQEVIRYLPAYLAKVIQAHFSHHGEEYYDEGKSIRTIAEHALQTASQAQGQPAPEPIREMAKAARLIRGKTKGFKQPFTDQLNLFGNDPK